MQESVRFSTSQDQSEDLFTRNLLKSDDKNLKYHILLASKNMVIGHDDLVNKIPLHTMSMKCQSSEGVILKIKTADFLKFMNEGLIDSISIFD